MAKLQTTEIVGVANTPGTIALDSAYIWFDTVEKRLKITYCTPWSRTWASGGALITARQSLAGGGTQNEAFNAGGGSCSCTEEYNGTSWSSGGALITGRGNFTGGGSQNAGLTAGGFSSIVSACTEEYNGTSWSSGGALSITRIDHSGVGTQNAFVTATGVCNNFSNCTATTEEYNGTSWTTTNCVLCTRVCTATAGTQNAAVITGGDRCENYYGSGVSLGITEEYNGNTWRNAARMPCNRLVHASAGTSSDLWITGGAGSSNSTFEYDGLAWSMGTNLITGRSGLAGNGSLSTGLVSGGNASSTIVGCTEEYSTSSCVLWTHNLV